MLDLKAKLAAAGVVTQKQVEDFDTKQAKSLEEAAQKKQLPKLGKPNPSKNQHTPNQGNRSVPRAKSPSAKERPGYNFEALKKLNKGEAYDRLRKLVARTRLDDGERTIPGPDDLTFNFVTSKGRIGRLYLKNETIKALSEGSAAISAFMSHHGQAHCVLPKDLALGIAQVFPLWLRHLRDHPAAGQIEVPDPVPAADSTH